MANDSNPLITCSHSGTTVTLIYQSPKAAGAIGKAQGEAWLNALDALQTLHFQTLRLELNSSGAHFGEPMEGLAHLNAIAEKLWAFRRQDIHIQVQCPGWLYGGMAMILASVAHEIILKPQAQMGLFGSKLLKLSANSLIPDTKFNPTHLKLTRLSN